MYSFLQGSSLSVPIWLAVLGIVVPATAVYFATWLNRKKPSSVKVEDKKTENEAQYQLVQTLANVSLQLKNANVELAQTFDENIRKGRELREVHAGQIQFLQAQVSAKDEKIYEAAQAEKTVRGRFHASQNEIQRCIFKIRDYEELLRHCKPKIDFAPFDFTPYADLLEGRTRHKDDDAPTI